jgi:hypothetical protein
MRKAMGKHYEITRSIASSYVSEETNHSYGLLVALFLGELLLLKGIGRQLKHARQRGSLAWERMLRHGLERQTQSIHPQMHVLSQSNRGVVVFDLIIWWLLHATRGQDAARRFALAVGGVAVLRRIAKRWVDRERPALVDRLRPKQSPSFPSGHASDTMATLAALVWLTRESPWRTAVLLVGGPVVFLIGVSRIALDRHYPTDVLGGWATALIWVMAVAGEVRYETSRQGFAEVL